MYFYSTEHGLLRSDNIKDVHEACRYPDHGPGLYCAFVDVSTYPHDTGDIPEVKTGCDYFRTDHGQQPKKLM